MYFLLEKVDVHRYVRLPEGMFFLLDFTNVV